MTHAANHFLYFGFGKFLVMSDPGDIVALVRALPSRPRGRGCIVLTHAYEGQREWAAELARQTGSEHIDLMALFVQDTDISRQIGQFHVPRLFEFLTGRSFCPRVDRFGCGVSEGHMVGPAERRLAVRQPDKYLG